MFYTMMYVVQKLMKLMHWSRSAKSGYNIFTISSSPLSW